MGMDAVWVLRLYSVKVTVWGEQNNYFNVK